VIIETLYDGEIIDTSSFPADGYEVLHDHDTSFEYEIINTQIGGIITTHIYFADDALNKFDAFVDDCTLRITNQNMFTINAYGTSINYKNHVPKLDVKTFVTAFCNAFKILPIFNHAAREVELVFMSDLFAHSNKKTMPDGLIRDTLKVYSNDYDGLTFNFDIQGPDDLQSGAITEVSEIAGTVNTFYDLPSTYSVNESDVYYVRSLNAFYTIGTIDSPWFTDLTMEVWVGIGDRHWPIVYDNGAMEITTSLAPLMMRNYRNHVYLSNRSLPAISALGCSKNYDMKGEFPLRVLFYVGLTDTEPLEYIGTATEYPFASTTKYDTAGTEILPISYTWEDLTSRYFLPVIAWWKRRQKIEFTHMVTPAFISNLNLKNQFLFQNTLVFFSEVVVKIKNKLFGPGDFEGWTN
jgi:hypothetical protein